MMVEFASGSNEFKIQIDLEFTKERKVTKKKSSDNSLIPHKNLTGKKAIKSSYVVIDIETTGLHSGRDEIIEIGAIKIIDSIEHQTFQSFVKPKITIPYNITKLTGITNSMVVNANDINTVLKDFIDFIEDYPLVGHNIDFDIKLRISENLVT